MKYGRLDISTVVPIYQAKVFFLVKKSLLYIYFLHQVQKQRGRVDIFPQFSMDH